MDTPALTPPIQRPETTFMCITETLIPANAKKFKITAEQGIDAHFLFEKMIVWELVEGGLSIVGAEVGDRPIFNWSEKNPSKARAFEKSAIGNGIRALFLPGELLSLYIRNDLGRETKIAMTGFGSIIEPPK